MLQRKATKGVGETRQKLPSRSHGVHTLGVDSPLQDCSWRILSHHLRRQAPLSAPGLIPRPCRGKKGPAQLGPEARLQVGVLSPKLRTRAEQLRSNVDEPGQPSRAPAHLPPCFLPEGPHRGLPGERLQAAPAPGLPQAPRARAQARPPRHAPRAPPQGPAPGPPSPGAPPWELSPPKKGTPPQALPPCAGGGFRPGGGGGRGPGLRAGAGGGSMREMIAFDASGVVSVRGTRVGGARGGLLAVSANQSSRCRASRCRGASASSRGRGGHPRPSGR